MVVGTISRFPSTFIIVDSKQVGGDVDVVSVGHTLIVGCQHEVARQRVITAQKHN